MLTQRTNLGSNGVGASREQLGDACCLESSLSQTESSAQPSTTGTDNDSIKRVIDDGVGLLA